MTSDEMDIIGTNDGAGLGGDRDTTNVFESSNLAASVITTIAEAKAGITKHGRPVGLGGPFLAHIKDIIYSKAASLSSPVVLASSIGSGRLIVELCDVNLRMLGNHQLQNDVLPHVYLSIFVIKVCYIFLHKY
ncbi:unnamed protein product [Brassica rapa subsp. narinosa]